MRVLILAFAVFSYAVFFATFLYLIAFTGNLPVVLKTVDSPSVGGGPAAIVINVALIALFGVQHSVMARQGFKRAWTRIVPEPAERSVYVLLSSLCLIALFVFWRPIPGDIWRVEGGLATALWALFAAGWGLVLLSTFLLNHFELFGLQQGWFHLRRRQAPPPVFRTPLLYRAMRHPLYAGFFLAFWATPHMTYGHALLAFGLSIYMLVAIGHEERDLVGLFGDQYSDYQKRVGMLVPGMGRYR